MSDYSVIPQKAIDSLLANPEKAGGFDAVFGKGRAAEVLASRTPVPEPQVEQEPELSFLGKVWDSTGVAIKYGVQEAANETVDAFEAADIWMSQKADELGIPSRIQIFDNEGNWNPQLKFYHESLEDTDSLFGGTVGEKGDALEIDMVSAPQTVTGQVVGGITQFAAGFVGAGKFTKLSGMRGAFVNGAIADAIVFDPKDPNITAMLEQYDIDTGAFGDVMATDPDDPEFINRLRNVAEGALAGGIMEAIGWGIRARKARLAGKADEAAELTAKQEESLRVLDDAIKEAGNDAAKESLDTLELAKEIFDEDIAKTADDATLRSDAEGQIEMDLGDTPTVRPGGATDTAPKRIFLTPERVERIRLQSSLAKGANVAEKQADLSFRSLDTVNDFDEVLDDIAGVQAVLADEFTNIKGGDTQRWVSVKAQAAHRLRKLAEMAGKEPEELIKTFQTADLGDPAKLAAEIHARSRVILTAEQDVQRIAKVIADALSNKPYSLDEFPGVENLDQLRLMFNQRREVAANLLAGQDALRSNVARAMNAMKISVKGDKNLREMLKDPSKFKDIDEAAKAVADPENAGRSFLSVIDETLQHVHGYMDKINTFRINALLSGPGTQEVNFISNVVQSFVIPLEQALGGLAKGDIRMMQHAMRQLQGSLLGSWDSLTTALQAGWWDDAVLDPFSAKIEEDALRTATTKTGKVVTLPSRVLMTQDEFFKQSQYRGRVFADAHAEAAEKGLKGVEKDDFIKKYVKESYDKHGAALRGDALLQARRATFTEPLDPGLAAMIQKAAIDHPLIRFFVPFVRTPINILSNTFQHFPLIGQVSKRYRADIAAGGVRAAQARGKQMVGMALVSMAGWFAAQGLITGSGPQDPRIRKVWLKNNQPYAFRIVQEDGSVRWVSYARLEPLSNVFSIAADAVEIMGDKYNEAEKTNIIQALTMAVMENTVNKTFTQGVYDAMSLFVGRPHEQEMALRNFVSSFVPNVLNQTNGDDVLREARTWTDAVMARTGLYNNVDPKRNVLGEPIVRTLPKYNPLGLGHADVRETDTVLAEITRLGILNQTVADNPSKRIEGPNRIDLSQVPYSETQTLYDRWVELTGEVKMSGKTLREKLEEVMDSTSYQHAPDGYLGSTSKTKGAIVRKIIEAYRKKARSELPELMELIKAERMGGASVLKAQVHSNRKLFPSTITSPERVLKRRTFEDLLQAN